MGIRTQDSQHSGAFGPQELLILDCPLPVAPGSSSVSPHSLGQEGVVTGLARLRLQLGWEMLKYLLQVPQLSVESPFPAQAMGLPPLNCFTGRLLTQETQKALLSSYLLGSHSSSHWLPCVISRIHVGRAADK